MTAIHPGVKYKKTKGRPISEEQKRSNRDFMVNYHKKKKAVTPPVQTTAPAAVAAPTPVYTGPKKIIGMWELKRMRVKYVPKEMRMLPSDLPEYWKNKENKS